MDDPPVPREDYARVSLDRSYILSHSWRANLYNVPVYRSVAEPVKDIALGQYDYRITP